MFSQNVDFKEIKNIYKDKSDFKIIKLLIDKNKIEVTIDQINECEQNPNKQTNWKENCSEKWSANLIVDYLIKEINLNNPYSIKSNLIKAFMTSWHHTTACHPVPNPTVSSLHNKINTYMRHQNTTQN